MDQVYHITGVLVVWALLIVATGLTVVSLFFNLILPIFRAPTNAVKSMQLEWAIGLIKTDRQWLAHDPVARAICERHLQMLQEDWEKQVILDISKFRDEVGLNPHKADE